MRFLNCKKDGCKLEKMNNEGLVSTQNYVLPLPEKKRKKTLVIGNEKAEIPLKRQEKLKNVSVNKNPPYGKEKRAENQLQNEFWIQKTAGFIQ